MLPGLFAAGDVAGGAPKKYIPGCWVEGQIAAKGAVRFIHSHSIPVPPEREQVERELDRVYRLYAPEKEVIDGIAPHELEERLQHTMDEFAGGRKTFYEMNQQGLSIAQKKLMQLKKETHHLLARDFHALMRAHEVIDRIDVARVLLAHLLERKETRWPGFQTRSDFPQNGGAQWCRFINSYMGSEHERIYLLQKEVKSYQKFH